MRLCECLCGCLRPEPEHQIGLHHATHHVAALKECQTAEHLALSDFNALGPYHPDSVCPYWVKRHGSIFCSLLALCLRRTGTDVAVQSAGVTLVKGDLRGILRARQLSQATMANIKENLFFAFIYNALGVPIAAGVLYPFFGLLLSPMISAAAMSVSSVSVVGNALRLRRLKL